MKCAYIENISHEYRIFECLCPIDAGAGYCVSNWKYRGRQVYFHGILLLKFLVLLKRLTFHLQESLKCTVELLDMLGIYLVLTKLLGRSEMKVMITAVGVSIPFYIYIYIAPL